MMGLGKRYSQDIAGQNVGSGVCGRQRGEGKRGGSGHRHGETCVDVLHEFVVVEGLYLKGSCGFC